MKAMPKNHNQIVEHKFFNRKKEFYCALNFFIFGNRHQPIVGRCDCAFGHQFEERNRKCKFDAIESTRQAFNAMFECKHRKLTKYGSLLILIRLIKHLSESIVNRLRFVHIEANNQCALRCLMIREMFHEKRAEPAPHDLFAIKPEWLEYTPHDSAEDT